MLIGITARLTLCLKAILITLVTAIAVNAKAMEPGTPLPSPTSAATAPTSTPTAGTPTPAVTAKPVEKVAASPAPLVSVGMTDGKIETAAAVISSQIGMPVKIYGKAAGVRVSVLAQDQPIEAALGMLTNPAGLIWWYDAAKGEYGIADKEYYEKNLAMGCTGAVQKVFRPKYLKASELERAIKGLLTPNLGSSIADDRTNKVIVYDRPEANERIEKLVKELDVPAVAPQK